MYSLVNIVLWSQTLPYKQTLSVHQRPVQQSTINWGSHVSPQQLSLQKESRLALAQYSCWSAFSFYQPLHQCIWWSLWSQFAVGRKRTPINNTTNTSLVPRLIARLHKPTSQVLEAYKLRLASYPHNILHNHFFGFLRLQKSLWGKAWVWGMRLSKLLHLYHCLIIEDNHY
jgi:hypothetical protein